MENDKGKFESLRDAVKFRRDTKDIARENGITLKGRISGETLDLQQRAETIIEELKDRHAGWVTEKQNLLGDYLSAVDSAEIEKEYKAGVAAAINLEVRVNNKVERNFPSDTSEYLEKIIAGYTFDFYWSLRVSKRLGIDPETALKSARLSYVNNPEKIRTLQEQSLNINQSGTTRAILSNEVNPEDSPEKVKEPLESQIVDESSSDKEDNLKPSFESITNEHYKEVFSFACRLLGDTDAARDVTQDTFEGAGKALENFRGDSSIKTWLFEIVRNQRRTRNSQSRRRVRLEKENKQLITQEIHRNNQSTPESLLSQQETGRQLESALEKLNPKERAMVMLHFGLVKDSSYTFRELAELYKTPRTTVHRTIQKALEKMRKNMRE